MTLLDQELIFLTAERSALTAAEGGFARQVAVLALAEPDFAAPNRAFLEKVLAAANIDLHKDALLAEMSASEPRNIAPDIREKKPKQVLVFGIKPAQLGVMVSAVPYQTFDFYGCSWLFADPLSAVEADKVKKGQLWAALKQMFAI
jgi:hypothetical protein